MQSKKYNFVIVGSGAGGGTLARELSRRGKEVLVVERGRLETKLGTVLNSRKYFDYTERLKLPRKTKEGVVLLRALMLGGTTVVSAGNIMRSLEQELADIGVDLKDEFLEAERDLKSAPLDIRLLSKGSQRILTAARELGYKMEPMVKAINPVKCKRCGNCMLGCVNGAKWSALDWLREARKNGAEILCETRIDEILVKNGKVEGVRGTGTNGPVEIQAEVVILSAGWLGTPIILQKSGFKDAGKGLFAYLLVAVSGVTEDLNQLDEPKMALVDEEFYERGFSLVAYVISNRMMRLVMMGPRAFTQPPQRLIGIATMIRDDPVGRVYPDGSVSKPVTERDRARLLEGTAIAKQILVKAGADEKSIEYSLPAAAAPGGTAAIGRIVDTDLQTEVKNLFVCDASVLPESGKSPMLTIIALAKRLAKRLIIQTGSR